MYEFIMTACSAAEAQVWGSHLRQGIATQAKAVSEQAANVLQFHSPLTAEMRSVGAAFGKPGSFTRRMSVHRSATVGPTTDLNQVIIKNTQAVKDTMAMSSGTLHIPRSQSTATPSHVQTLAPRRVDRSRLETLLADVWSPALPYPGMIVRRTDQLKGSADQIIRKLSIASLANSFHSTKRNGSHTSMTRLHRESESSRRAVRTANLAGAENKKPVRLPLSELLPADFELQPPSGQNKRRNALRALTMTMERPFSPLLSNSESSLRRAQSMRHRHEGAGHAPASGMMATVEEGRPESAFQHKDTTDEGLVLESSRQKLPLSEGSDIPTSNVGTAETGSVRKKPKGKGRLRRLFG